MAEGPYHSNMKLRNKKTGEIGDLKQWWNRKNRNINGVGVYVSLDKPLKQYNSLAELNEEWEDYEEPKTVWYIDAQGNIQDWQDAACADWTNEKSIGNYFETKEEAEKAVEKLKAWKRLKDKGFRFTLTPGVGSLDITPDKFQIEINADMPAKWFCCDAVQKDLDDCFGGEE